MSCALISRSLKLLRSRCQFCGRGAWTALPGRSPRKSMTRCSCASFMRSRSVSWNSFSSLPAGVVGGSGGAAARRKAPGSGPFAVRCGVLLAVPAKGLPGAGPRRSVARALAFAWGPVAVRRGGARPSSGAARAPCLGMGGGAALERRPKAFRMCENGSLGRWNDMGQAVGNDLHPWCAPHAWPLTGTRTYGLLAEVGGRISGLLPGPRRGFRRGFPWA